MQRGLVGSEMCIRDRYQRRVHGKQKMKSFDNVGFYDPTDYERMYYDFEKKRFFRGGDYGPSFAKRLASQFATQRPDLYSCQYGDYFASSVYANRVMINLNKFRLGALQRYSNIYGGLRGGNSNVRSSVYLQPVYLDYQRRWIYDQHPYSSVFKLYHWDDMTRMAGWLQLVFHKLNKYGMMTGALATPMHKDLQEEEDTVTEYFLKKMSQRPTPTE
eukprot:TRINITY_DN3021_c0_g1_i1.p1 TRINITY_DN3021_c0_g1~~TRINITY_DN3021_c0_g1_i1.p1  ORF type:complete len:216 (-),score=25.16 TRINITY_DN3021_c0_g1_i1:133-780(-)